MQFSYQESWSQVRRSDYVIRRDTGSSGKLRIEAVKGSNISEVFANTIRYNRCFRSKVSIDNEYGRSGDSFVTEGFNVGS